MNLGEFLSPEAGQRRRRWVNAQGQAALDSLGSFLGPGADGTLESVVRLGDMFNPVAGVGEAMAGGRQAYEEDGWGRVEGVGRAASGVAATVAPMAIAGTGAADDGVRALSEALLGWSPARQGARNALADFAMDESGAIRAFHGSPHDFDRFQMDKIGTGEGAQAYGHGLYFAENEGVARSYRDALAANHRDTFREPPLFDALDRKPGQFIGPDVQRAIARNGPGEANARIKEIRREVAELQKQMADEPDLAPVIDGMISSYNGEIAELNQILEKGHSNNYPYGGRMYEVNINADPEDFLDWDAPLSEGMLWDIGDGLSGSMDRAEEELSDFFRYSVPPGDMTGREAYMWLGNTFGKDEMPDGVFSLPERAGAEYASRALKDAGIPGIRYYDQSSRGADGGTRNYVVFDENLVEIVRKYGIAGAASLLGMSAADVQAAVGQPVTLGNAIGMDTDEERKRALREYLQ